MNPVQPPTVRLGGSHCCMCSVICHHIGGPFFCSAHAPDTLPRSPADFTRRVQEHQERQRHLTPPAEPVDLQRLRKDLIQVAAMATAWADAIDPLEAS